MDLIPASQSSSEDSHLLILTENAQNWAGIKTKTLAEYSGRYVPLTFDGVSANALTLDEVESLEFDGRIDEFYISEPGQYVSVGDRIAQMYIPDLIADQEAFLRANTEEDKRLTEVLESRLMRFGFTKKDLLSIIESNRATSTLEVRAKRSGYVTEVFVKTGNGYKKNLPLYRLNSQDKLWVYLDIPLHKASVFKIGDSFQIQLENAEKTVPATLIAIDDQVGTQRSYIQLTVEFDNREHKFKPGLISTGEIKGDTKTESFWIPASAVLWTGKNSIVYLKIDDGFAPQKVSLGELRDSDYEVVSGLSLGDEIVIEGAFVLDAESQLQGKSSMMSQPGDKQVLTEEEKRELATYLKLKQALVRGDLAEVQSLELPFIRTENLDIARTDFFTWTKDLEKILQRSSLDKTIYKQQCPMAFDNSGAYWFSLEKEIENPYFGSEMLECGTIKSMY